jgi:hypothetical protein
METVAIETISGAVAKMVVAMGKKGEVSSPRHFEVRTALTCTRNPTFTKSYAFLSRRIST